MKDLPQLIRHSWRTVAWCSLVLGSVIGSGAGLAHLQTRLRGTLDATSQERNRLRSEHDTLAGNLRAAKDGRSDFNQQQRDGLVGPAQREEWVQSLIAAYQSRHFTGTPEYKLKTPTPWMPATAATGSGASPSAPGGMPGATAAAGGPAGAPGMPGMPGDGAAAVAAVAVQVHELNFQLAQAHEADVLGMLDWLQTEHSAIMRVKGCALTDAESTGLKASCTVQFLNVARAEGLAPGAAAAMAAAPGVATP